MDNKQLLDALADVARKAADVIMAICATDFAVHGKDNRSPVTEVDEKAEAVILAELRRLTPDISIVAEEA